MQRTTRRVAVIGGNRIPFARSNTAYAQASNQDLLTAAIDGLVSRYVLEEERLGEVVAGAVLKHSRDFNLTREAVLGSRLAPETPAYDLQQACDTGIQSTITVANKIALGQIEVGIAGGTDTTSDAPIAVNERLRRILLEANRAETLQGRLAALAKVRPQHLVPSIPRNSEPRTGLSMGESAALTALEWDIGREEQDELAVASHQHLAAAYDRGFFDDLVTPFLGLERDQNLRPDSSVEKLAKLTPVFGRGEAATMTAANSTPLTDGASVVLLCSEDYAEARGWEPLAFFTAYETAAVDYVHGGEGLLMAPAYAMSRMLAREELACRTSTSTRSTKPLRHRCWPRSGSGRTRCSARSGSDSSPRSEPSTGRSSMSRAPRWRRVTPSRPPAVGSWPRWRSCSPRKGPGMV